MDAMDEAERGESQGAAACRDYASSPEWGTALWAVEGVPRRRQMLCAERSRAFGMAVLRTLCAAMPHLAKYNAALD